MGCNTSNSTDNVEGNEKEGKEVVPKKKNKLGIMGDHKKEGTSKCESVEVPEPMNEIFRNAEEYIEEFFGNLNWNPKKAEIRIGQDRFVLIRGPSLTVELYKLIMINSMDEVAGENYYRNLLFDLSHNMGKCDCEKTFEKNKECNAIKRLSCGPVYFSFTGFARVKLLPGCVPSTEADKYLLFYEHPYSFEAHAFKKEGFKTKFPICIMSSGYSSGWCSVSFGINDLVAFELTCVARGDPSCCFVMAHRDHIHSKIEMLKKGPILKAQKNLYIPKTFTGLIKKKGGNLGDEVSMEEYKELQMENKGMGKRINLLETEVKELRKLQKIEETEGDDE